MWFRSLHIHTWPFLLSLIAFRAYAGLPFGVQSNDGDVASAYATSMIYDSTIDRLYLTGSTYGQFFDPAASSPTKMEDRDCFMAALQLPRTQDPRGPTWLRRQAYGDASALETCSDITFSINDNSREFHVVGHTTSRPNMTNSNSNETADIYGMVLDLNLNLDLKGGSVLSSKTSQYPVAVISDNLMTDIDVYVLSIEAELPYRGSAYETFILDQYSLQPNPSMADAFLPPRFAGGYAGRLSRLRTQHGSNSSERIELWTKPLELEGPGTIFTSSLIQHPMGGLLVAGFTDGTSSDFGSTERDGSVDGFITGIDPADGSTVHSMRLRSQTNSSDRIYGLCIDHNRESSDVFVVGMTDDTNSFAGDQVTSTKGSYKAFMLKLDARDFSLKWASELRALPPLGSTAPTEIYALACAVTEDDNNVYMAGTIKNGATITLDGTNPATESYGKDDVFVVQLNTEDGTLNYVKQLGSSQKDGLATGNSVAVDKDGNGILLINTMGSMLRQKRSMGEGMTTEVAVVSIDRYTGEHVPLMSETATPVTAPPPQNQSANTDGSSPELVNTTAHTATNNTAETAPNNNETKGWITWWPQTGSTANATNDSAATGSGGEPYRKKNILIAAIVFLVFVITCSTVFVVCMRHKAKDKRRSLETADQRQSLVKDDSVFIESNLNRIMKEAEYRAAYLQDDHSLAASFVSGKTLRGPPDHKDKLESYNDTLLRLQPSQDDISVYSRRSRRKEKGQRERIPSRIGSFSSRISGIDFDDYDGAEVKSTHDSNSNRLWM